jgi:hypothetical protein
MPPQAEDLYNEAKRILNLLYDKRSMKLAEVRASIVVLVPWSPQRFCG